MDAAKPAKLRAKIERKNPIFCVIGNFSDQKYVKYDDDIDIDNRRI